MPGEYETESTYSTVHSSLPLALWWPQAIFTDLVSTIYCNRISLSHSSSFL